jgi:hypothetical protein
MSRLLSIPRTIALLSPCWQTAEERVRSEVGTKYLEADEDFITKLVYGELRDEFDSKNSDRQFEKEFAADIRREHWTSDLTSIATGLIARVVHHPRHIESRTGGDFGLVVARPHIDLNGWGTVVSMHAQGYLCRRKNSAEPVGSEHSRHLSD